MTAQQRRDAILDILSQASGPVSAAALAGRFGVSRQLIVGDVALLRAGGAAIDATARGYVVQRSREGLRRQVACRHQGPDMEKELQIIVDNGCTVLDVIVEHPVYGQTAQPLSLLTEGVHLHTLLCPGQEAFLRVREELADAGFLLEQDE